VAQLVHTLAATKIAQAHLAEVDQVGAVGQRVEAQVGGQARHQHLTAVTERSKSRAPDHGLTEIVTLITQLRLTRMNRHAHTETITDLSQQLALGIERRSDRICRPRKRCHDRVALALLDRSHPTVTGHSLVEDGVMPRHSRRHHCRISIPTRRRTLDVSQEERDGPSRQGERSIGVTAHHEEVSHAAIVYSPSSHNITRSYD